MCVWLELYIAEFLVQLDLAPNLVDVSSFQGLLKPASRMLKQSIYLSPPPHPLAATNRSGRWRRPG